jgi:hypothetical protein
VIFEGPSRLAGVDEWAFFDCRCLNWLFGPASVKSVDGTAFAGSGIVSIEISQGSDSLRVRDEFLFDFESRSLILVIGSPERILIPASIEELLPFCCSRKGRLMTVEFESDSTLRSIGRFAFTECRLLESIYIPSSVEVLCESCFADCSSLRTVAFGAESKLRLIEARAFSVCESLKSIYIPSSVEVLCEGCFAYCSSLRTVTFWVASKLRLIEKWAFYGCPWLESVSLPDSVEVLAQRPAISVSRS